MNVFLHAHTDLGKFSSVGIRTEYIAQKCLKNNILGKALCRSIDHSEIPKPFAQNVMPFFKQLDVSLGGTQKYVSQRIKLYRLRTSLFDSLSVGKILPTDIYHTWQIAPKSLARAKGFGAKTVWDVQTDVWKPEGSDIDYVFAASRWLYKQAVDCGYEEDRVLYNPFGADADFFRPGEPDLKVKRYLYVGLLGRDKGVRELLLAWKRAALEDAVLVLCGRVTPFFKEQYRQIAPNNVELLGFLDAASLREEYMKAYAFVFPSHREGGCKVTYEALASGLPAIVSERAGTEVEDGVTGHIIDPKDVEQLLEMLVDLHHDEGRRAEMAVAARQTAERFTWKAYAERTMNYYNQIAGDA